MPLDLGWRWDEKVDNLSDDFGAPGALAAVMFITAAKAQHNGGEVRYGWRGFAKAICADTETTKDIVAACKLEKLVTVIAADGEGFHVHLLRYNDWNPKDPTAAERQARKRLKDGENNDDSVTSVTSRRDVTKSRVEKSRKEEKQQQQPVERLKAIDGETRVIRGLFDDWRARCGHPTAKLTHDRMAKVRARLREGYSPEFIRSAIDGAARAAFVNERGKRFDDLELVCRSGSKLEDFAGRNESATVVPLSKAQRNHERIEQMRRRALDDDGPEAA